jgi:hypothetical protein
MNSQDFRSLQEAYMDVYNELDEGAEGGRFQYNQRHGRPLITPEVSQSRSSEETLGGGTYERGPKRLPKSKRKYDKQVLSGVRAASDQEKERARKRMGIKEDIYDIILSHLIDEGYADTQEAAERIMVNMSEEWRESIVETRMDPRGRPASGPMNVYANPKGKPSQAHLDAVKSYEDEQRKKTPEQRKAEQDDYRERQMNNK